MRTPPITGILRQIGGRVADVRRARGWTQLDLAERLDVSPRYLQAIEGGTENLTIRTVVKLAATLGVEICRLLCDAGDPRPRPRRGRPARSSRNTSAKRGGLTRA